MPDKKNILSIILGEAVLLQLGERVLAIIQARTLRGEFLPGSTSKGYSTKTAGMPYGGLAARIGNGKAAALFKSIVGAHGNAPDKIYTNSKSGKIWITLHGGYKQLRELAGRETDRVTLNWTGQMMSALAMKVNAAEPSLKIYFTNKEAEKIAGFHHDGAGRSKIKRIFVGLSQQEQAPLELWLGEQIAKKIQFVLPTGKS
jgi:hypothetical protein